MATAVHPGHPRRFAALVAAFAALVLALVGSGIGLAVHAALDLRAAVSGMSTSSQAWTGAPDAATLATRIAPALVGVAADDGVMGGMVASGMVLSADGLVLTNNHVVRGAGTIAVEVGGGATWYAARVVGTDPSHDVALLQVVDAPPLAVMPLGDFGTVQVGDRLAMAGNAHGLGGAPEMSAGRVSSLHESITAEDGEGDYSLTLDDMLEVLGSIQPGESGGPMVDAGGRVVAMTTAATADSGPDTCYGIPVDRALAVAEHIKAACGGVVEGWHCQVRTELSPTATPAVLDTPAAGVRRCA